MLNSIKNTYKKLRGDQNHPWHRRLFICCFWLTIFLVVGFITFESRSLFSQTFPSCSSLTPGTANTPDDATPGFNCYYFKNQPPCRTIIGVKKHRENCSDLIDLPLCSTITPASDVASGINCAKEAREVSPIAGKIRGVDYAVNNKDSIRFCGQIEACNTAAGENCNITAMSKEPSSTDIDNGNFDNCVKIKCHQKTAAETPNKNTNCDIIGCNLLTVSELSVPDNRFSDDSKQYCDGSAKCYDFFNNTNINEANSENNNSDNLKYVIYRNDNPMCQIHNCKPDSESCGADDTLAFDSTNPAYKGDAYKADYSQYINGGMPTEGGLCKLLNCQPVASRQYVCNFESSTEEVPSILNPSCDQCVKCETCMTAENGCPAGFKKQECGDGYCSKKIDCNLAVNRSQPECIVTSPNSEDTDADLFDAWFYRPTPPSRITDSNGLIKTDIKSKINDDRDSSTPGVQPNLCYDVSRSNNEPDELGWGTSYRIGICSISCDRYYWHTLGMSTRSPRICGIGSDGRRGNGYGYLCGTEGNIFKNPRSDVGYIKGVASVDYELTQPEYKIKACLRYTNSGQLGACGDRECRFNIAQGPHSLIKTQWCGDDVCKEMKISQDNIDRCSMSVNSDISNSRINSADCVTGVIDPALDDVRMRMRKYGRHICVFVDQRGAVAYNNKNFDGSETIVDKTRCSDNAPKKEDGTCEKGFATICIDGNKDSEGKCQGKNTNDDQSLAEKWRTVKMIKYVGDNRGGDKPGYVDMNGQFFPEQDCAKIPLRLGPPRLFNVATSQNSRTLFEPPLFVLSSRTVRGGAISPIPFGQQFGPTDFYQPEIVVQYGSEQQRMSLSTGYLGDDETPENFPSSPWSEVITTSYGNIQYSADAFVKKEYSDDADQPLFCLYRNVVDQFGAPLDPIKLTCVKRNKPEIRVDSLGPAQMKVSIAPDASNIFNNAKLKLRLIANYGTNNANDNCAGDDVCTNEIIFQNTNVDLESCSKDIEKYKFCSKRDDCSKLLYECANNEINLNNAMASEQLTAEFEAIKTECNTTILSNCNKKFGITDLNVSDFLSQINNSVIPDPNYQNFSTIFNSTTKAKVNPIAYGWFNEICIVKGFEEKLKDVIANKFSGGVGKCVIDINKSLYSQSVCNNGGGKAPYCVCQEFIEGMTLTTDQVVRKETPREAGLCIDIPLPKFCPAIDHTPVDSADDFASSSIVNSRTNAIYNDSTGVHTSHQRRTLNTPDYHHAEYSPIIGGSNNVAGSCKGFWKVRTNSQNELLLPKLNCKINGTWEKIAGNDCERYSCPEVYTEYSNTTNSYINNYANKDAVGNEGLSHGYALWHSKTKDSDFLGTQESAYQCITGFKPNSSGQLPKRFCNQKGEWESSISNACQRITCPAQFGGDGTLPASITTDADRNKWIANGGAEFPVTNASRSNTAITPGSTATGTCKNNLGFFRLANGNNPTRTCDHLGNWSSEIENACVTLDCDTIGEAAAKQEINGFALWPRTGNVPAVVGGFVNVKATSCATGWTPNPYAPTDPATGEATLPTRHCSSVAIDNGWATVWDSPILNKCINKCPGYNEDPVNGRTSEKISSDTNLEIISWNSTDFGSYDFQDSNCSDMNASLFTKGRTNKCYRLRRLCGNGDLKDIDGVTVLKKGQWGKVEPMCVANGGRNGNATYFADTSATTTGSADSVAIDKTTQPGTCVTPGFNVRTGTSLPIMKCVYEDANGDGAIQDNEKNIDKVHFKLSDSSTDCEALCSVTANQNIENATSIAAATKFPGEIITLKCQSGFGNAFGSGGDSTCGRNASDRSSNPPTTKCKSDGTWEEVTDDCTACRGCTENDLTSTGANVISPTTVGITDYGCNAYTLSASSIVDQCKTRNVHYAAAHNATVDLGSEKSRNCKRGCCGRCNNERNICSAARFQCIDGYLKYILDISHTLGSLTTCNDSVTQCGSTSQSCGRL